MERMRRLRVSPAMRSMVRENHVRIDELVYPVFVMEGQDLCQPVDSMPGICQYSIDRLPEELNRVTKAGIPAVLLFGIPAHKDEVGSGAYDDQGIVQQAVRFIKSEKKYQNLIVIADVCLCEYTSHGHCGLVKDGIILNDETLPLLAKTAVSYAKAGADIIAPSDMMDSRVRAIREALDENGFVQIPIMAYSAKFASAFYGPFRDAAHSVPGFGDRKTYQMDVHNRREAVKEALMDIEEGADIVMVKPAMAYGDIIREVKDAADVPVAAYSVSGEYAMIKAAAAAGYMDEEKTVIETAVCAYRAGADLYISYFAEELAQYMKEGKMG